MIEVNNLVKRYGNHTAVDHLSFKIEKGKIYGFLGPNGAGKSTTMNMITGYIASTEGTVKIDGHDILEEPEAAKKCIGYLPEQPPVYFDMTVLEYMKFVADLKKIPKDKKANMIEEVMDMVKISDMRNRLIKNLSKGYRQRVGLAEAIMGYPEVIILDEPTVGLDPKQIIEIRKLISALRHEHTIILSTHILQEVNAVCSTVAVINKGKLAASGSVSDFTASEGTVNKFVINIVGGSGKSESQKVLQSVDGVRRVDFVRVDKDAFIFNVESERKSDVRRGVFNAVAHANMAVIELRPVGRTLEEIFIEIVSKEQSSAETD